MSIVLDHLVKRFGDQTVVSDVSLEVAEGELFVLLGPSGSGKSTVLRLIAGLLGTDGGKIRLHGKNVTDRRPQERGVGFVFQNYALFRHMSVAQNIEFALKIRRVAAADRRRRRDELLEMTDLVGLGGRFPHQLSGGQQQRVALARALAHRPEVLLLDEPFGALDAKIRTGLRRSLRRIQSELGVTTIFVTHDQEEGFELADRAGVMNFGRLLEIGPPEELYFHPQTEFVATFLGRANLMVGRCRESGIWLGEVQLPLDRQMMVDSTERRVQLLFRPEDVALENSSAALRWPTLGEGVVEETGFSGSTQSLRLRLPQLKGTRAIAPVAPFGADDVTVEATRSQHEARRFPLNAGDRVWIGVRRIHALPHPGLSLMSVVGASPGGRAAIELATRIAHLAQARLSVLGLGIGEDSLRRWLGEVHERLGERPVTVETRAVFEDPAEALRLEMGRRPYDLVLQGSDGHESLTLTETILGTGEHHLLRVPPLCDLPRRALICVAVGEPGKEDLAFAGRLLRHLGSAVTILTVLPDGHPIELAEQARRFLEAGARMLGPMQIEVRTLLRRGRPQHEIEVEIARGGYDLVVVGAPLPDDGSGAKLVGLTKNLVRSLVDLPVLVVCSQLRRTAERGLPPRVAAI